MKLPSTRSQKLRLLCGLPGWIPWGNFRGNRSCWRSIFTFFHILFTSHTLQLTCGNLCSWKNQKRKKVLGEKKETKEKKTGPKKKERVPKISLWKRLALAELYAGAQISNKEAAVKQRFAKHDVKASTSLDTKTLMIVSNRNFESFMSIRCLAPQHIFRFFHFCYRFFLCPW